MKQRTCPPFAPKLSESLKGPVGRDICQSCGNQDVTLKTLDYWIECDDYDAFTPVYVVLCRACSQRLVGPHVRLYNRQQTLAPIPGLMGICEPCIWRHLTRCNNPKAVFNGGPEPGLDIKIASPTVAFVDGPKFSGRTQIWHTPATGCSGLEVVP